MARGRKTGKKFAVVVIICAAVLAVLFIRYFYVKGL
jgi:hypothetical protein